MAEYIERETAEIAIAKLMPSLTTPDSSGPLDEIILCAQQMCAEAIEVIRDIPVADVKPVVHGRFKTKKGNYITGGGNPLWCCSNCGQTFGASLLPPKHNYCSNCGAKMKDV